MIAVEFVAGLGDFIRQSHRTNSYTILSEVEEPVDVIIGSHNPFTLECFTFHPNRKHFHIHYLPHKYVQLFEEGRTGHGIIEGLYEFAGVDIIDRVHQNVSEGEAPVFYAPDDIDERGHVIVQPFAGGPGRNIPDPIVRSMIRILLEEGLKTIVVSRSYIRTERNKTLHGSEKPDYGLSHPNLFYIDDLTVPATLNLVKNAKCFVGAHSSLLQMAWYSNIPACVLYPEGHTEWRPEVLGKDYTWGSVRKDCLHTDFNHFSKADFFRWVTEWCSLD